MVYIRSFFISFSNISFPFSTFSSFFSFLKYLVILAFAVGVITTLSQSLLGPFDPSDVII